MEPRRNYIDPRATPKNPSSITNFYSSTPRQLCDGGIPIGEAMRNYEITNIIREGAVEEAKLAVKDILTKHLVTIQSEEDWGSKKLWHPIGDEEHGHFTLTKCESSPSEISKIAHEFKLNPNILKTLVIRTNG